MSSAEAKMHGSVSGVHADVVEKGVPDNVKAENEIGVVPEGESDLMLSTSPTEIGAEAKEGLTVNWRDEDAKDAPNGSVANLEDGSKLVSDDSQPKASGAADGIDQPSTEEESANAENSVDRGTTPVQGTLLNGILSLVGLGSSKPVVAEDDSAESRPSLSELDHEEERNGVLQSTGDGKESESNDTIDPYDSKDAASDDVQPLNVRDGDLTDNHGLSASEQASKSEIPSHEANSTKVVEMESIDEPSAVNGSKLDILADTAESGDRPREADAREEAELGSPNEKATTAVEPPKAEDTVAPATKTGLLELVGGGVLSLIGLGGAKHAAESPSDGIEKRVEEEAEQNSSEATKDAEISKRGDDLFELVDSPVKDDLKPGDITEKGTADATKDEAMVAGNGIIVEEESPEVHSNGIALKTAGGADGEVSGTPPSYGGDSDDEISRTKAGNVSPEPVDTQVDHDETTIAKDYPEGDPPFMMPGNELEGGRMAEKASEKDLSKFHTNLTDYGEAGKFGSEVRVENSGNEDYLTKSSRAHQPSIAAGYDDGNGWPAKSGNTAENGSDIASAEETNQRETGAGRKGISSDADEPDHSASPALENKEKNVQHGSVAEDTKENHLPMNVNVTQQSDGGIYSQRGIPENLQSNKILDPSAFASEQRDPRGLETTHNGIAGEESVDPDPVGGVESRSKHTPNMLVPAVAAEEQGTTDVESNGHANDYLERSVGDDIRNDDQQEPSATKDEALPATVRQQASSVENESETQKKIADTSVDGEHTSKASIMPHQQFPGIDRADSKARSIFGITLKHVQSGNRTPTIETDSQTMAEKSPTSRNIGQPENSLPLQVSSSKSGMKMANPNTKDESASLVNGDAEDQHDGMMATEHQGKQDSSKHEPTHTPAMVPAEASQESNRISTPDSVVTDATDPEIPFTPPENDITQMDSAINAGTASHAPLSDVANQEDMSMYIPKQEDGMVFDDAPLTTPQSLNESRSTTPPETPLTQHAEHLEQKHPPSPADDQSAPRSPVAGALPVGVQNKEWSTSGDQTRDTTGNTSASEYVKATNAFARPTVPESHSTMPVQPEKGASVPTAAKPTVKRSKSKSGVAKLKTCFTGCSGAET